MMTIDELFSKDELKLMLDRAFAEWFAANKGANDYWHMSCINDCIREIVEYSDLGGISVWPTNLKLMREEGAENGDR